MILFINADPEFQSWRSQHKEIGYIIGCEYWPKAGQEMMLHHAWCPHTPGWEAGMFSKACSTEREELVTWAEQEVHGSLKYCHWCNP